ncbi:T9SS type A sorting domain-containing protein [Vicingaceae bacterium]|nr:T9SS type A sorting domain-containing protein [Vicingaceae bacterium]MDC1452463.1 T9SS type A sorting domain-containing protein [Vicingaceae bacterium]
MKINNILKTLLVLFITASAHQTIQAQFCVGLTTLTAVSDTFTDGSGNANYANNTNCSWLIQPKGNPANITFTMDSINLSGNTDAVRVYDGTSAAGVLIAIYRGNNLGNAVIANSGSMFVQFTSNFFGNAQGWAASYTSASSNCQPNTVVNASNGAFTDGTRNGFNYDNNTNCEWLIQPTAPGVFVEINFSRFSVAGGDSLILYDGTNASAPILGILSGNNNPGIFQSSGGALFVRFVTNSIGVANGWRIVYNAQRIPFCRGITTLIAPTGLFSDGSLPFSNYIENSSCEWLIQPPGAVSVNLQFNYFSTEANFDLITVYQGTNNNGLLLGSFSGNRIPPIVTSTTGSMFIEFNTDGLVNSTGWEGSYTSSNNSIITSTVDTVYLNAGAGSRASFQLNANANWTATDNQSWLVSTPVNSTGNQIINLLAIQGNLGPERTAQLYVNASSGNGGDTVIVIQRSSGRFLEILTDTLSFSAANAVNQSFNLLANVSWTCSVSDPWISINPINGSNNSTPQVSVSNNTTKQIRTGSIIILGTQNAGNDTIFVQQDSLQQSFIVTPKNLTLNFAAGSKDSVQLNSNSSWTATTTVNWLSISPNSGGNSSTLVITANTTSPTTQNRNAVVILNSSNGLFTDSVNVTQLGIPPSLTTNPDTVFLQSDTGLFGTINIVSNGSWNARILQPLFELSSNSGKGNASITVKTISINQSGADIMTSVIFTDTINNLNSSVIVVQKALIGTLAINPDSLFFAPASGESSTISINSNTLWAANTSATWLNLSKNSGNGDDTLTVSTTAENRTGNIRTATVIVNIPGGRIIDTVVVSQFDVSLNFALFSVDTLFLGNTSGSVSNFSVIANGNWTLAESTVWLALNKTNGTNTEDVTARAGSNNLFGAPRYAKVTVSSTGNPNKKLVVAQLGATLSFSYTPDSLIIGADSASSGKFNITSNLQSWNASITENWLSVTPIIGTLTAEITVTATKPNTTSTPRSGIVTISSPPFTPLIAKVVQDTVRSIGIKERGLDQQISIFPNPSTGQLNIRFDSGINLAGATIEIFDIVGKSLNIGLDVLSKEHLLFNLAGLNKGFYIVKINVGQKSIAKKILLLTH